MIPAKLLRPLRLILADLFTEEANARRIVTDAGMDDRYIDFSGSAIDIWHDILDEAQKHPSQLDQLVQIARDEYPENQALAVLVARYQKTRAQQSADLEDLLTAYLRQVVQATSSLILPELTHQSSAPPAVVRLELTEIYTALDTLHLNEEVEGAPQSHRAQRQSVLSFVNNSTHCLLLGDPGSGKTIFANFLALCLAGARLLLADTNLSRLGAEWTHGPIWPLHLSARSLAAHLQTENLGEDNPLWAYLVATLGLAQAELATDFAEQLITDGAIVIIDGFDEPAVEHQERLTTAVATFCQRFPSVRVLLTSRLHASQLLQTQLPAFATALLASFSPAQIDSFIHHWYQQWTVPPRPGVDPQTRTKHLQRLLRQYPALHELATRPLLLALLTMLHALRPQTVPTSQIQIFESSIAWLLAVWEGGKTTPDLQTSLQLSPQQLRGVMEELAFTALARPTPLQEMADVTESEVVDALLRATQDRDLRPLRVLEYIHDRAGLLRARGPRLYSFPHRAIQEYLAACHLLAHPAGSQELIRLARQAPERWREAVLWVGRKRAEADPAAIWPLARQLCEAVSSAMPEPSITPGGSAAWLLTLLAGRLLVEARVGAVSPDNSQETSLLTQVRNGLLQLITTEEAPIVERANAGTTLGELGDPRPGVGIAPEQQLPEVEWLPIAPEPFLLGSEPPSTLCSAIEEPYAISRYPITVAQYRAFIDAGGYSQRHWWTGAGWDRRITLTISRPETYDPIFQTPNHPQVGVSWFEAVAFCRWLSAQLGQQVELPTEFQWERAARHLDGRTYPWGDEFTAQHCNARPTNLGVTTAVGLFAGGNAFCGAADMAGNVWEWCRTAWISQLRDYTPAADNELEGVGRRALRGGSFANPRVFVRCANRHRNFPSHRASNVGFRVVLALRATS